MAEVRSGVRTAQAEPPTEERLSAWSLGVTSRVVLAIVSLFAPTP